jgi:hypothetical protein
LQVDAAFDADPTPPRRMVAWALQVVCAGARALAARGAQGGLFGALAHLTAT